MSQKLISLNSDLKRLRDEGYEIEVLDGHILVYSIPYVNVNKQIQLGTLVSELSLAGTSTIKPSTHVIHFMGEYPCSHLGIPIEQIRHTSTKKKLSAAIEIDHSFSNKPSAGYSNYYEKIIQYAMILSHPAKALDNGVEPRTFKPIPESDCNAVFKYVDTASSRAGIQAISEKLSSQRIAIVGLGGTGSYILDFVAKTPVREIHLFDEDSFLSHNAFRAPGAASLEELSQAREKVHYFTAIYTRMHSGIVAHPQKISKGNVLDLTGFDYVFLCIDSGSCKKIILETLVAGGCVVIDAGIDIQLAEQTLLGTCRVTTCTKDKNDHIYSRISMGDNFGNEEYASNIQVAELNALNACLAVIKWKQLSGFYQDLEHEHHLTYSTNCALLDTGDQYYENTSI